MGRCPAFERWVLDDEAGRPAAGVGDEVAMLFGYNRTPLLPDPDRFDAGRGDSAHIVRRRHPLLVSARLAREELDVAVGALACTLPDIELRRPPAHTTHVRDPRPASFAVDTATAKGTRAGVIHWGRPSPSPSSSWRWSTPA